ncbi:MAG: DUF2461 domain-containing protein [Odoribacter sp.]|nr:DUF2461 domain-containing protein [Odoribacter sp.]
MNPIPFLEELSLNNNRPWFQAHKDEYERVRAGWLASLDRFIAACSQWEPAYGRHTAAECSYRIYRDTRFSPDKTPYKTYFSAALSPRGRKSAMAGIYISAGIDPQNNGIWGGLWCPDAAALRKMRHAIVDNIEEWEEIISSPQLEKLFPGWCGKTLKTIPKGWERDHPQAIYLRMLDYGKEHTVDRDFWSDYSWPERAAEIARPLKPLLDFINYSLFEE